MNNESSIDLTKPSMWGHICITDKHTNEILADCYNQIHFENMSKAIAKSLSQQQSGFIQQMAFGNGGSVVNGSGAITYFPPNITSSSSQLYNETYRKVINDNSPADLNISANFMRVSHTLGLAYSDLIITCTLDYSEPSGQEAFDDSTNLNGSFVFDELGLISYDTDPNLGSLLTHVIFNPIQKSLNRQIEIVYTIRISLM